MKCLWIACAIFLLVNAATADSSQESRSPLQVQSKDSVVGDTNSSTVRDTSYDDDIANFYRECEEIQKRHQKYVDLIFEMESKGSLVPQALYDEKDRLYHHVIKCAEAVDA